MSKVVGGLTGSSKVKKGAKRALNELSSTEITAATPFGNTALDASGNLRFGENVAGTSLANPFERLAGSLINQAGGNIPQGLGLTPDQAMSGAAAAERNPLANMFGGASAEALQSLGSFDFNQFAADRFSQLQDLARPGEERAASGLANRLFSRGRVGGEDTTAGRAFGELDQAQAAAETQRFIDSRNSAGNEFLTRIGAATNLGQTSSGLRNDAVARFMQGLSGGIATQGASTDLFNSLLGGGIAATGGIHQAFAPSRDAIQTLLGISGLDFQRDAARADVQMGRGQAEGAARGNLTGSIIGGIFG